MLSLQFQCLLISYVIWGSFSSPVIQSDGRRRTGNPLRMEITEYDGVIFKEDPVVGVEGEGSNPEFSADKVKEVFQAFDEICKTFTDMIEKLESFGRGANNDPIKLKENELLTYSSAESQRNNEIKHHKNFKGDSKYAHLARSRRNVMNPMDMAQKPADFMREAIEIGVDASKQGEEIMKEGFLEMATSASSAGDEFSRSMAEHGGKVITSGMEKMGQMPAP